MAQNSDLYHWNCFCQSDWLLLEKWTPLAVLSRHVGVPFLSFILFLLCWAPALCVVLFIYFLPTIHVRRQQVSLFVSGKNWSWRESLLSDIAPTRCTFHANNGTTIKVARLQPDQCTCGGPEMWWVRVHYMSYVLDLALQQLADGLVLQCQQRPFLTTSTFLANFKMFLTLQEERTCYWKSVQVNCFVHLATAFWWAAYCVCSCVC